MLPQEIAELSRGVDFRLPGILALSDHGRCHNIVSVLCGDEVGCLEEDG
jgi:hypothetical protein